MQSLHSVVRPRCAGARAAVGVPRGVELERTRSTAISDAIGRGLHPPRDDESMAASLFLVAVGFQLPHAPTAALARPRGGPAHRRLGPRRPAASLANWCIFFVRDRCAFRNSAFCKELQTLERDVRAEWEHEEEEEAKKASQLAPRRSARSRPPRSAGAFNE